MKRLNKTESVVSNIVCSLYFSRILFPDYLGCNSCRCFCVELVKFSSCIDIVLIIFHILVILEYCVLTENRILLKADAGVH